MLNKCLLFFSVLPLGFCLQVEKNHNHRNRRHLKPLFDPALSSIVLFYFPWWSQTDIVFQPFSQSPWPPSQQLALWPTSNQKLKPPEQNHVSLWRSYLQIHLPLPPVMGLSLWSRRITAPLSHWRSLPPPLPWPPISLGALCHPGCFSPHPLCLSLLTAAPS